MVSSIYKFLKFVTIRDNLKYEQIEEATGQFLLDIGQGLNDTRID